jgi:nitrite reductase (NADH) large subunit
MKKPRLIVVGSGMAAARFLEEFVAREGARRFQIEVFGEEPTVSYNRVLLSSVLEGSLEPQALLIHDLSWYRRHKILLRLGVRVDVIARPDHAVHGSDGRWYPYDVLVLATGSRPYLPPISGLTGPGGRLRPGAFVFRTLGDCERILQRSKRSRRAVVIGGGLLGLEAAWGLHRRGLQVDLVHLQRYLMEQQLDPQAGTLLGELVAKKGISLHLGRATQALLWKNHRLEAVSLAEEGPLPADLVVVATGIRPEISLAARSGLAVERGVLVDDCLRSVTDPTIYAIGDCAEHRGKTYGLLAPAWEQARVLAEHLSGNAGVRYEGTRVAARLKVAGLEVLSLGRIKEEPEDEVVLYMEPKKGIYRKLLLRGRRLEGAIVLGETRTSGILSYVFEKNLPVPHDPTALLFDWAESRSAGFLPEGGDDTLCQCNGVARSRVLEALRRGARSVEEIALETRAGTGCGSCRAEIRRLIGSPPFEAASNGSSHGKRAGKL